ncbi:MAG: hypothetical protein ACLT5P_17245 [Flavonifractor plautii]
MYHCYSESGDAKVLVKLGWMLSFTGVITYKMHERLWKSSVVAHGPDYGGDCSLSRRSLPGQAQ